MIADLINSGAVHDLQEWWRHDYLPEFHRRYDTYTPDGVLVPADVYVALRDDTELVDWRNPLEHLLVELWTDEDRALGFEGLKSNVEHKMRFSVRTGLPSSQAVRFKHLVRRGDFPFAGADRDGGASGLKQESDVQVYGEVTAKWHELLGEEAALAIADSGARAFLGAKYLFQTRWPQVGSVVGGDPVVTVLERF